MHDALATDYFPLLSGISMKWRLDNILVANQHQKHQSHRGGDPCCLDFAPTLHRAYSKVASRRSFKIWHSRYQSQLMVQRAWLEFIYIPSNRIIYLNQQ